MVSRSQSSALRSGVRHAWFQPGWAPELQPQSLHQRSMPWAQLQELFSTISTSSVGGYFAKNSP